MLPVVPWRSADVGWALLSVLAMVALGSLIVLSSRQDPDSESLLTGEALGVPVITWFAIAQGVVLIAAAYFFSVVRHKAGVRELGFTHAGKPRDFGFAIVAWLVALGITVVYGILVEELNIDFLKSPDTAQELLNDTGGLVAAVLLAGLWAPLNEELFFRGFILSGFAGRYGVRGAIVISRAIFAAFHVHPGAFVPTFVLGAAFAVTYARSGSLVPSIFIHAANNTFAILFAYAASKSGT